MHVFRFYVSIRRLLSPRSTRNSFFPTTSTASTARRPNPPSKPHQFQVPPPPAPLLEIKGFLFQYFSLHAIETAKEGCRSVGEKPTSFFLHIPTQRKPHKSRTVFTCACRTIGRGHLLLHPQLPSPRPPRPSTLKNSYSKCTYYYLCSIIRHQSSWTVRSGANLSLRGVQSLLVGHHLERRRGGYYRSGVRGRLGAGRSRRRRLDISDDGEVVPIEPTKTKNIIAEWESVSGGGGGAGGGFNNGSSIAVGVSPRPQRV